MAERLLIRGGTVVTLDSELGEIAGGDVLVEGDRIAAVGASLDVEDAEILDADGRIVIPGLVDSHRHTWQSVLHVVGPDWLEVDYLNTMRRVFGPVYRPEDVYVATLLGCAESIDSGITTLLDWAHLMNTPEHADAAVAALRDSGMRAVFAYGNSNAGFTLPNDLRLDAADARRVRDEHFSGGPGLVTMALAVRGPDYSSMEVTRDDFGAARELGLPITVHVGSNGTYGRSVAQLAEAGLLGPDVTHVHCNTTLDEELALIRDSGGTVSVSPEAEMHLGCGMPPIARLVRHGLNPSISTDVPSVVATDLFGAMRVLLAAHRGMVAQRALDEEAAADDPWPRLTTADVLRFATVEGARATGLGDVSGRIAPGRQADLTVIARRRLGAFPATEASADVVLASTPADVEAVLVAGQVVKRDGRLTGIDVEQLRRRAEASRDHLVSASEFTGASSE